MEPTESKEQIENSKPWLFKKGESGNPGGRPKGSFSVTTLIKNMLDANDGKQAKQLAQALILQAAKGNGTAIKEVLGRTEGAVPQVVQYETSDASKLSKLSPELLDAIEKELAEGK